MKGVNQLSDAQLAKIAGISLPEQAQPEPAAEPIAQTQGLWGNISRDLGQRGNNINSEVLSTLTGQKPLVNLPFRYGGELAGGAYDVLGNVGSAVTPDIIEEPIKSILGELGNYVSQTAPAQAAKQAYGYVPEDIQDTLEGALSMGAVPPAERMLGRATAATEQALNVKKIYPNVEQVAQASRDLFGKAREMGANFSPQVIEDLSLAAKKNLPTGKVSGTLIAPDEATKFAKGIDKVIGKSSTLDDFEELDRYLGGRATANYVTDPDVARKFTDMQVALRESVQNPKNVTGNSEGIAAHREATRLWGIKKKMDDINHAIEIGGRAEVPATGIKSQFKRIADNDKLMRGYSDLEKESIRKAAKTGELEGVIKAFGSRLNIIGGTVAGGTQGALLGMGLSGASRTAAEATKNWQGNKVMKQLGERSGLVKEERRISPSGILGKLNK